MNNYNNMTISEKLTCFVDGELAPEEGGDLFFELAKNPEYQEELRQLVLMKNTFKNSIVAAPPALKSSVMKKTIYRDSPYVKLANAVALLLSFVLTKSSLTYAGIGLIAITSIFLLKEFDSKESPKQANNNFTKIEKSIPVVNSKEVLADNLSKNNPASSGLVNNKIASNYKDNSKKILINENAIVESESSNTFVDNVNLNTLDEISYSSLVNSDYFNINLLGKKSTNLSYNNSFNRFLNKLSFSFKKFDGNSTPNFNLGNSSDNLFNNMSIGLNYNIDYNHSIGLAIGFENFLMDFDKYEGDILFNYRQSYNTQWLGIQYAYTLEQIGESGIRPNLNLLAGATNVGPILKLGAGITYHVSDYFSITGGIESGWLFYTNNGGLDNSKWFNTHKLGYNFGINMGL